MLSLKAVSKSWPDGTEALRAIDLNVADGEIVAIIGGSGCGKTTLLRLAAGLEAQTAGSVSVAGRPVRGPDPSVGIVFQEPRLLPWLNVAENITFGIAHLPKHEQRRRAMDLLARLGLADHDAPRWPRGLSGGQAQRIAIARALAPRPRILLLDEPFSALDAITRSALHGTLLDLWAIDRPTMVLVTHDVDEAVLLADRVVVMQPRPGRMLAEIVPGLARPRDPLSSPFIAARAHAMAALDASLAGASTARRALPAAA
jgi:sulfonate transport system ATP-binding protein